MKIFQVVTFVRQIHMEFAELGDTFVMLVPFAHQNRINFGIMNVSAVMDSRNDNTIDIRGIIN